MVVPAVFQAQRHRAPSSFCQWHFNDDLISLIFAFLGDGRSYAQAAGLAQVCKDWRNCVRFHSSFWTALDVDRFALPRAHVEDTLVESLLRRYRDMVQSVTIRDCLHLTERSVLGVAAHCPNLVSLDVESVGSYLLRDLTASVVAVVDGCRGLRHLNLSSCPNLSGAAVRHIGGRARQLQSLRLRHNARLACDDLWALRKCTELRVLDLGGCSRVRDRTVLAVCAAAGRHLRVLNLAGCPLLTDGAVKAAFELCGGLESLDVCGLPLLTKYAFLPLVQRVGGMSGLKFAGGAAAAVGVEARDSVGGGGGGGGGGGNDNLDGDVDDVRDDSRAPPQAHGEESGREDPRQRRHQSSSSPAAAAAAAAGRQPCARDVKRSCGRSLRSLRFSVTQRMTYATARNLKALRPDVRVFFLEPRMGALEKKKKKAGEERTVTVPNAAAAAAAAAAVTFTATAADDGLPGAAPRKRKVVTTKTAPAPAAAHNREHAGGVPAVVLPPGARNGEAEEKVGEGEGEGEAGRPVLNSISGAVLFRHEGGRGCGAAASGGGGGGGGGDAASGCGGGGDANSGISSAPLSHSSSSSERAAKLVRLMR